MLSNAQRVIDNDTRTPCLPIIQETLYFRPGSSTATIWQGLCRKVSNVAVVSSLEGLSINGIDMSTFKAPVFDTPTGAPAPQWYENEQSGHIVQFYTNDDFLVDSLSRVVGTALGGGDAAIVVATKAHRTRLAQRLTARGISLPSAIQRGRYLSLDASETLTKLMRDGHPNAAAFTALVQGLIDQAHIAAENHPPRVVIFGEMVALLWAEGKVEAAMELEGLWNELAKSRSFRLHCAYPLQGFNRPEHAEHLAKICHMHSAVIPSETYSALLTDQERFRNITELQQKAQALESATAEKHQIAQSLRRRETELSDFLQNAAEGVQQIGPDQHILWANNSMLHLLGYDPEEYVNHNMAEFYVDPEEFQRFWHMLVQGEEVRDFSADLRCNDGSAKQVMIHSNGLWDQGRFQYTRCFVRDVTEQKKMEQALRASEAHLQAVVDQRTSALRRLSVRILSLQDAERRRIARELHDSLGQYLTGLKIDMDMLRQQPYNDGLWLQAEEVLARCLSEVRTLSYLLHPPMMDEAGLSSAARWYLQGFAERSGIKVNLEAGDDVDRLPDGIEVALFRVLQEALTNVHRHAGATEADVRILRDAEQVMLQIRDNGRGIPLEVLRRFAQTGSSAGVGLTGIHERVRELGGVFQLESDNKGTSLLITVPVVAAKDEHKPS
jgi:PAS domain S-box-containing protein